MRRYATQFFNVFLNEFRFNDGLGGSSTFYFHPWRENSCGDPFVMKKVGHSKYLNTDFVLNVMKFPVFGDPAYPSMNMHYLVFLDLARYNVVDAGKIYAFVVEMIKYHAFDGRYNTIPDRNSMTIIVAGRQSGVNFLKYTEKYDMIFISTKGRRYSKFPSLALRNICRILVRFFNIRIGRLRQRFGENIKYGGLEEDIKRVEFFKDIIWEIGMNATKAYHDAVMKFLEKLRKEDLRHDISTNISGIKKINRRLWRKFGNDPPLCPWILVARPIDFRDVEPV